MPGTIDVSTLAVKVDLTDINAAQAAFDKLKASAGGLEDATDGVAASAAKVAPVQKTVVESVKATETAVKATSAAIEAANAGDTRRVNIVQQTTIAESARSKAERDLAAATGTSQKATESAAQADARRMASLKAAKDAADAFRASEQAAAAASAKATAATPGGATGEVDKGGAKAGQAKTLSDALSHLNFASSSVTREFGVMFGEIVRGDFSRLQASTITLTNRMGLLGMAFSATGAAVAGVAATIGVFIAGAIAGHNESDALTKSLIATNNAAGETASNLNLVANSVGKQVGSYGDAREAIQKVVASGTIFSQNLDTQVAAIVNLSKVTGESIEDVVKDFQSLQKDPVNAVVELNDKYHFLTLAIYDQIAALEAQGKTAEAAGIAEKAYGDYASAAIKKVDDNLGLLGNTWKGIKTLASEGWDAIKDVGRTATDDDRLKALKTQLEAANRPLISATTGETINGTQDPQKATQLQAQILTLQQKMVEDSLTAQTKQLDDARQQEGIKSQKAITDGVTQFDTASKKKLEIAKATQDKINALAAVNPNDPNAQAQRDKIDSDSATQIAGINARGAKKGGNVYAAQLGFDEATYKNQIKDVNDSIAEGLQGVKKLYAEGSITSQEYYANEKSYAQAREDETVKTLENEKAALAQRSGNAAQDLQLKTKIADIDQQITDARSAGAKARLAVDTEEAESHKKFANAIIAVDQQADNFALARSQTNARSLAEIGQGGDTAQLQKALDQVTDKYNQLRDNATKSARDTGTLTTKAYTDAMDELNVREKEQVANERLYAQQRLDAQGDWVNGATKSLEDYQAAAANTSQQIGDGVTTVATGVQNVFQNMFKGGKVSLDNLLAAFLDTLTKMEAQKATSALAGAALNAIGSYFGGSAIDYGSAASSTGISSSSLDTGIQIRHAKGGIITHPTITSLANGGTLVRGEANDEATVPLTRTSDGRLGVASVGGSGVVNNVNIINQGGGTVQQSQKKNQSGGIDTTVIVGQIKASIAGDIASGRGDVHGAIQERFGLNSASGIS